MVLPPGDLASCVSPSHEDPSTRPAASEAPRVGTPAPNVSEFLGGDHRRLDAILSVVEELAEKGAFAEAAARFVDFARGLSRHIDMEETVLFPAFEEKTGMTSGPTAVMRAEHVEIRRLLEVLASALAAPDESAFREADRHLHEVLGGHNEKEEGILYPLSDRMAGGERERDELVRKMQAIRIG